MREVKGLHDEILRPLLLTRDTLPPCFEEVEQMGVNRCGEFFFVQKGTGDICGIVCGFDNDHCSGECFKNSALYFTPNGEPLFFCRYYYTIFKGKKYVDEKDDK